MLNKENLRSYIADNTNKVRCAKSEKFPVLEVIKYKNNVFYDNLWDDYLVDMRGLVVDDDDRPVIMPFRKVFYDGEREGVSIDPKEEVIAPRKINGFMAAVTYVPRVSEVVVSTTGSLDSGFVKLAKDYLPDYTLNQIKELYRRGLKLTWLFEIVHHDDPHIIEEDVGAYLIGAREIRWNGEEIKNQSILDGYAEKLGVRRPEWKICLYGDLLKEIKTVKHEGFMVYGKNVTLKLKSPYYNSKKLFARMTEKRVQERLADPNRQFLREVLDEEFYPLIDHIDKNKEVFVKLDEQARLKFMRKFLDGK